MNTTGDYSRNSVQRLKEHQMVFCAQDVARLSKSMFFSFSKVEQLLLQSQVFIFYFIDVTSQVLMDRRVSCTENHLVFVL